MTIAKVHAFVKMVDLGFSHTIVTKWTAACDRIALVCRSRLWWGVRIKRKTAHQVRVLCVFCFWEMNA